MKFKRNITLSHGLQQIHIAPMIDCVFLLLIFFIISAPLTSQLSINVKLPKAITSDVIKDDNLIITVTNENVIYLNGHVVTLKELRGELTKLKNKNLSLLIKADKRSSVGRITDIWDMCRNIGIEKINIATHQDH